MMKFLVMCAAWAFSAVLVFPTVSQAESQNVYQQLVAAADRAAMSADKA